MRSYACIFMDLRGSETISFEQAGATLQTSIRGVRFSGNSFDSLSPDDPTEASDFSIFQGDLCDFHMKIPILVVFGDSTREGLLDASLQVEKQSAPNPSVSLQVGLSCENIRVSGSGKSGWFEGELLEIQHQLPEHVFIKSCINCLYSDYSPCGHGGFGAMLCFRDLKQEYLQVRSKQDFWPVLERCEHTVAEAHLCPDFVRRIPGTGYRG